MEEQPLCAKEIAPLIGVSARTAQRLMASGEIESFRPGAGWLLRAWPKSVDLYLERVRNQPFRKRSRASSEKLPDAGSTS